MLALFFSGEFLLHIPCWLLFHLGSFSYTSCAGFIMIWGVTLTHPMLPLFFWVGVSLTRPMLASLCPSGEFLFHISCWLLFYLWSFSNTSRAGFVLIFCLGSFSYTSRVGFIFIRRVSLTHPVLAFYLFLNLGSFSQTSRVGFFSHFRSFSYTSCARFICYLGSFSYTSHTGFIILWGVSLTHPVLASFFHLGSFSYPSRAGFIFM